MNNALRVAAGKSDWLSRNAATAHGIVLFVVSLLATTLVHYILQRRRTAAVANGVPAYPVRPTHDIARC